MSDHEKYMARCLELAMNGLGYTKTNPLVGCVIVYEGKIIGEGYHHIFGGPHAEVNAINSVSDKSLLNRATLYVNLEPCSHWGKTPPCADLIIENQIPYVVIGTKDIYEEVNGRGIERLRNAGINVETGILEKESIEVNRRFFTFNIKKRPYIILKWAETADGFIAKEDHSSKWISNEYSRLLSHQWRAEESAIKVGTNTVKYDNPQLSSRDMKGKNPIRIVLDKDLKLPESLHIFDRTQNTIVFTENLKESKENLSYVQLNFDAKDFLKLVLNYLHNIGIQSVIVEGGAKLLQSFIDADLWDEARIFEAKNAFFEKGIAAPNLSKLHSQNIAIDENEFHIIFND